MGQPYPLDNNFTYHPPFGTQQARYAALREKAKELAQLMLESCPESRERSVALTELETSVMWANASIARNEKPPKPGDEMQAMEDSLQQQAANADSIDLMAALKASLAQAQRTPDGGIPIVPPKEG